MAVERTVRVILQECLYKTTPLKASPQPRAISAGENRETPWDRLGSAHSQRKSLQRVNVVARSQGAASKGVKEKCSKQQTPNEQKIPTSCYLVFESRSEG